MCKLISLESTQIYTSVYPRLVSVCVHQKPCTRMLIEDDLWKDRHIFSIIFSMLIFFAFNRDCHLSIFFLRKVSLELTSATNPPLFAEEDRPWANIYAHLPLLYLWAACHSMAWYVVCRSMPGIRTGEPQATEVEHVNLAAVPPGRPLYPFCQMLPDRLIEVEPFFLWFDVLKLFYQRVWESVLLCLDGPAARLQSLATLAVSLSRYSS